MAAPAAASGTTRSDRFRKHRESFTKLLTFLKRRSFVAGTTEIEKRVLRRQAKKYVLDEGKDELYYTGRKPDVKRKVVMDEDEAVDILKLYHDAPVTGGHSGINVTLSKISMWYSWSGMRLDVTDFIKSCDRCKQYNYKNTKPQASKWKEIRATEPLQLVGMDLIGPLPTTDEGYKYILTFTDYFSEFVEFFPLKSQQSAGVASCIQTFACRWGAPQRLVSDQGPDFVTQVNADLDKTLGIPHCVTNAYHLQMNTMDERTNETLLVRLSQLANEQKTDWADHLEGVAYFIRTQKQACAKYTPFFLMFGRNPSTDLEMDLSGDSTVPLSDEIVIDSDETVQERSDV